MIALIANLLGGRTWAAWLVVAVLSLVSVGGLYAYVDHQGYARATAVWEKKYDAREAELQTQRFKELERQASANDAAKARESERLAAEQARADELERQISDLTTLADADPNAARIGLGADSVERLNRIR